SFHQACAPPLSNGRAAARPAAMGRARRPAVIRSACGGILKAWTDFMTGLRGISCRRIAITPLRLGLVCCVHRLTSMSDFYTTLADCLQQPHFFSREFFYVLAPGRQ